MARRPEQVVEQACRASADPELGGAGAAVGVGVAERRGRVGAVAGAAAWSPSRADRRRGRRGPGGGALPLAGCVPCRAGSLAVVVRGGHMPARSGRRRSPCRRLLTWCSPAPPGPRRAREVRRAAAESLVDVGDWRLHEPFEDQAGAQVVARRSRSR